MESGKKIKEIESGKYGEVFRINCDIQYKTMLAQVALANEDGERNRLLRIQLAIDLQRLSPEEIKCVETMIQSDIDLTDAAIE